MGVSMLPVPGVWLEPLTAYRMSLIAAGVRERTIDLRYRWLRRFARAVGCSPWSVDDRTIIEWSASHDWAQDTRRSAHASVRSFYKWAQSDGRVVRVPLIPVIKQSAPMPHPAMDSDIKDARVHCDKRVALMIRLASEAGLRRGEVARVHTRDLERDLVGWTLVVHGKGGKDRRVPLTDSLASEIRDSPRGFVFPGNEDGHLSPSWVGHLVGKALPEGVTMHALRHRFATRAYTVTGDLLGVQRALGHTSPATTLRYIALSDNALRRVVEAAA